MIYFDYQATTPCDPRVVEKMVPYFLDKFGNPHARTHAIGWRAEEAVEEGRRHIASLIGADPKEIVFTSGATEANNLAIKGVMKFYAGIKNHIITCVTEHKCVLDTCRHLEQEGVRVTYLPVDAEGLVSLDKLRDAITEDTALVSIMAANNEIGVIQPIEAIGRICRQHGVLFHTDAAQAAGKIPVDVTYVDLLSLSSHKLYGPMGVGALYVRRKQPRVRLKALFNGGGQERGMRSGTVPLPLCVGFGEACRIAAEEQEEEAKRLKVFQDEFYSKIMQSLPQVYLNGHKEYRLPGCLNLSFAHVEGEGLMMGINDIAVSSGSACTSASLEPSYVLRALGVGDELAHTSLRISFGRYTTQEEVDIGADRLISAVQKLRDMSPLWEMAQQGIDVSSIQWDTH